MKRTTSILIGCVFLSSILSFAEISDFAAAIKSRAHIYNYAKKTAQDGAHLQVSMMDAYGEAFNIYGTGFKPDEKITIEFPALGIKGEGKASPQGELHIFDIPGSPGKTGGISKLIINREVASMEIEYPWGKNFREKPPLSWPD